MEGTLCWHCSNIAKCKNISRDIKTCENHIPYFISVKKISEIIEIKERAFYKYPIKKIKALCKSKGFKLEIERGEKRTLYRLVAINGLCNKENLRKIGL